MKASYVIIAVVAISLVAIIFYSTTSNEGDAEYKAQLVASREQKDEFMKSNNESPFKDSKESFTGLKYFEPDPKFRIVADLEPIEAKKMVVLPTSDNQQQRYIEYAYATFSVDDVSCRLLILEVADNGPFRGTLFLAFADQSSAIETYGAGRYLDVKKTPGATSITLDFNDAYNPYCAYNDSFSCPFPPKENVLNVLIAAGEKVYH
ncbi:MAG: DUF1684 domain-containing protein [Bacteroidota bacterium]